MVLVIGGAFQGKCRFAETEIGIREWTDGEVCTKEELFQAQAIAHLDQFIRRSVEAGDLLEGFAQELIRRNPQALIVSTEVGYGIVPMDPAERTFRELTGRICTVLAAHAEDVYRVVCGIGREIKHG